MILKNSIKYLLIVYIICLQLNLYSQDNLSQSKNDTTWWYPIYSSGMKYLEQNNFQSAENEFNEIMVIDDEVAYVYYALGLVHDKLDHGSSKSEKYLLEAIDLDPDFVEVHYYLGFFYEKKTSEDITHSQDSRRHFKAVTQINPHFVDGWLQWARVTERFFWPPHSEPAEILARGLKYNPKSKKLYLTFIKSVFWHSEEDQGIRCRGIL